MLSKSRHKICIQKIENGVFCSSAVSFSHLVAHGELRTYTRQMYRIVNVGVSLSNQAFDIINLFPPD